MEYYKQKLNWSEARTVCVRKGGDLTSIGDFQAVVGLAKEAGVEKVWTGANSYLTEYGTWKWSDGSSDPVAPLSTTTEVNPNYEMCASLSATSGLLDKVNCDEVKLPFVCKMPYSTSLAKVSWPEARTAC